MTARTAAAEAVEANADIIADKACFHLLNTKDDIDTRFGSDAKAIWTDHLRERILELATALSTGDPQMFASRLAWSNAAMKAREIKSEDLRHSLESLRAAVGESLHGESLEASIRCIDQAVAALEKEDRSGEALKSRLDAGQEEDKLALQYVQSAIAGNVLPAIQLVLDAVSRGMPIQNAYLKVLLPAQQEVGRLWHLNQISISEEHLVSYTTQRLMALLSTRLPRKPDNGYTVVCGSVSGNVHDIGIRAISYLLEFEGWRTIYLGADIPREELPAIVDAYEADLVMLSLALMSQISSTQKAIDNIREKARHPVKILVGGNGMAEKPDYWKELGADGYAPDAIQAIEKGFEVVTS